MEEENSVYRFIKV